MRGNVSPYSLLLPWKQTRRFPVDRLSRPFIFFHGRATGPLRKFFGGVFVLRGPRCCAAVLYMQSEPSFRLSLARSGASSAQGQLRRSASVGERRELERPGLAVPPEADADGRGSDGGKDEGVQEGGGGATVRGAMERAKGFLAQRLPLLSQASQGGTNKGDGVAERRVFPGGAAGKKTAIEGSIPVEQALPRPHQMFRRQQQQQHEEKTGREREAGDSRAGERVMEAGGVMEQAGGHAAAPAAWQGENKHEEARGGGGGSDWGVGEGEGGVSSSRGTSATKASSLMGLLQGPKQLLPRGEGDVDGGGGADEEEARGAMSKAKSIVKGLPRPGEILRGERLMPTAVREELGEGYRVGLPQPTILWIWLYCLLSPLHACFSFT